MCIYVFQVVHEVYTRFTEESTAQSTWENATESTEVEIKVGDIVVYIVVYMKSSDAKASKCHLKFSSKMTIFIMLVYLSSVISLK